ncbi:MAG TPA: BTAD domain-containing putative transcriptional regulator [Casimicrobiaceae bacterium]|nr:BTAD domain-containing putative transcriptional regulator [Casimicrobiaceae bacterium]
MKLSPPRLRRVVRRERVLQLLDEAQGAAIWIAAPAGFGKTTAAADYLLARRRRALWYRADAGDLDPASLFHYLGQALPTAAARRALPRFGPEYSDQLGEFSRRYFRAFFERVPDGTTLVIDDLHAAARTLVPQVIGAALLELPSAVQLLLLSRESPPVAMTPAQASDRLQVLDASVLAFTREESRSIVAERLPASVAQAHADRLHEITHGWPAELVLVCAGLQRDPGSIDAIAGHSRDAAFRLFSQEFFDALPETERRFMLLTALPRYVTPASATAMTGRDDADSVLDSLCARQLFVVRVTGARRGYRYHDLFRDFLRHAAAALDPALRTRAVRGGVEAFLREGDPDVAIALALDGSAWELAAETLERHAPALIGQGRRATLQESAVRIPEAERSLHPKLLYWMGVARMIDDERSACAWFEQAHRVFEQDGERAQMMLTAAQAVLAIHLSWHSHVAKDIWLERLASHEPEVAAPLSDSDRLRITTATLRATEMGARHATHDQTTLRLVEDLLQLISAPFTGIAADDRFIAADALIEHALETGERDVFERAVAAVAPGLRDPALTPWAKLNWLISFGTASGRRFPSRLPGVSYASAEDALAEAQAIAASEGLQGLEFSATYARIALANARGDQAARRRHVERLETIADARYPHQTCCLMQEKAGVLVVSGEHAQAIEACTAALAAGERAGLPLSQMWTIRLTEAQLLIAAGREDEAADLMDRQALLYEGTFRKICEIVASTARTRRLRAQGGSAYVAALSDVIARIKALGWVNYLSFAPGIAAEVWTDALEHGIEPTFLREAIRRRGLVAPRTFAPAWPWPLRIRLLGGFEVDVDSEPLRFDGKVQRKPLELLRFIAVHHPAAAPVRGAISALWPGAGAGAGKAALDVALHRLRKLVGVDDVFIVSDGVIRLDPARTWVDAAAFEHWAGIAQQQLDERALERTADLAGQLFVHYRGPLLGGEAIAPWALATRERLHARFVQLAASLGRHHERARDWNGACAIHERGIALDPLAEEFYRGLMRCHAALDEPAEVMRAFRRCRDTLSIVLGVAPAPETMSLLSRLRPAAG